MSVNSLKALSTLKEALATAARAMDSIEKQLQRKDPATVLEEESIPALQALAKNFANEAEAEENPVLRRVAFDEAACMVRKAIRAIEDKPLNWLVVWQTLPESVVIYSIDFSAMTAEQRYATKNMLETCAGQYMGAANQTAPVEDALEQLYKLLQELTPIWDSNNKDQALMPCTLDYSAHKVIVTGQLL